MKKIFSFILILSVIFSLSACGKSGSGKEQPTSAPTADIITGDILFKYYEDTTTDEANENYVEYLIIGNEDGDIQINVIECKNSAETKGVYSAPKKALEKLSKTAEENKMSSWSELDDSNALKDIIISCSFYENGEEKTASSMHIPENGRAVFEQIKSTFSSYCTPENKIG